ncbi:hypothetical protein CC2G_013465 [Coprinopsis cinerea AmutBmut pab1-1]|nr:hypothetical protein CC2G_013465 [Coprinopsis cinerea AmutBmut pab1-1]
MVEGLQSGRVYKISNKRFGGAIELEVGVTNDTTLNDFTGLASQHGVLQNKVTFDEKVSVKLDKSNFFCGYLEKTWLGDRIVIRAPCMPEYCRDRGLSES